MIWICVLRIVTKFIQKDNSGTNQKCWVFYKKLNCDLCQNFLEIGTRIF